MTAVEIIEEIRSLPDEERNLVVKFVRGLPNAETVAAINEPTEELPRFANVKDLFSELKS